MLRASLRHLALVVALLSTLVLAACGSSPTTGDCAGFGACTSGTSASTGGQGGAGGEGGAGGGGGGGSTTFSCKGLTCDVGKEECDVDANDEGTCFPLPKACAPKGSAKPTCACYGSLAPGCMCFQDPQGNFVIQCTMMM